MAIYHLTAKPVQRSAGKSSIAAAAYRSRSTLHDERQSMSFSYSAALDLVHEEIVGFSGDRGTLWNMAEAMENRKDATTAREYEVALPRELSAPAQIELAREFATWLNDTQGCVVDFAIHSGSGNNPHVHLLTTTRSIDKMGTMSTIKIPREWSDKKRKDHGLPGRKAELEKVRRVWGELANYALERTGIDARIDHRSYEDQGVDRLPTSHLGPAVFSMELDGILTRAGDHNRMVDKVNLERLLELNDLRDRECQAADLANRLATIDAEIKAIRIEGASTPTTTGTLKIVPSSASIDAVADREASKFENGLAQSIAERYKAKLFLQTWHTDLAPSILKSLRWVDVDAKALTLKTGEQVTDKGRSVNLSKGSDDAISVAISIAKGKGWKTVRVVGSDDFQLRAALALRDSDLEPIFISTHAEELFKAELARRPASPLPDTSVPNPEPMPTPLPKPEPDPDPKPEVEVESKSDASVLKEMMRRFAERTPLPATSMYRDDTRKLTKWACERWSELLAETLETEELGEAFTDFMKEQALTAGYSMSEIQVADLKGGWSKAVGGSSEPAVRRAYGPGSRKQFSDYSAQSDKGREF